MKLERARRQILTLDHEIEMYAGDQEPIGIRERFDPDARAWVATIVSVPECPGDWGLLAGEIIHNLRGALDHLVWDLAILNTGAEPLTPTGRSRSQFPICDDARRWSAPEFQRMIAPLRPVHQNLIEQQQPYHPWSGPRAHPLLTLEQLSNTDKHRTLRPAVLAAAEMQIGMTSLMGRDCHVLGTGGLAFVAGRPLRPGIELYRIPLNVIGPDPKVEVELGLKVSIGLDDGTLIHDALFDIEQFVREALTLFEADLSTPAALATLASIEANHRPAIPWVPWGVRRVEDSPSARNGA